MGWTSKTIKDHDHQSWYESESAINDFIEQEINSWPVAVERIHVVPGIDHGQYIQYHELYCVIRNFETYKKFLAVILVEIMGEEIFWKIITENEGPAYYNCPPELFQFALATNEAWRAKCKSRRKSVV